MFNQQLFNDEFSKTGLRKKFVSDKLGMSYQHFVKMTNGEVEWKIGEADAICALLKWNKSKKEAIFFAKKSYNE